MRNRSLPTDAVLPHVVYRSVPDASAWLARVFDFKEHYRHGEPVAGAQMFLGNSYVMITGVREGRATPAQAGCGTQMLTIIVPDVDAHYRRAKQAGAIIVEELHETVYGERQYAAMDLDGHRWLFSQHARDLSPEAWGATVSARPDAQ